jgi:hypothetical protein
MMQPNVGNSRTLAIEVTVTPGTTGNYGTSVALNANDDRLVANADYALLGYTCDQPTLCFGIRGPDTGFNRIPMPGHWNARHHLRVVHQAGAAAERRAHPDHQLEQQGRHVPRRDPPGQLGRDEAVPAARAALEHRTPARKETDDGNLSFRKLDREIGETSPTGDSDRTEEGYEYGFEVDGVFVRIGVIGAGQVEDARNRARPSRSGTRSRSSRSSRRERHEPAGGRRADEQSTVRARASGAKR